MFSFNHWNYKMIRNIKKNTYGKVERSRHINIVPGGPNKQMPCFFLNKEGTHEHLLCNIP